MSCEFDEEQFTIEYEAELARLLRLERMTQTPLRSWALASSGDPMKH